MRTKLSYLDRISKTYYAVLHILWERCTLKYILLYSKYLQWNYTEPQNFQAQFLWGSEGRKLFLFAEFYYIFLLTLHFILSELMRFSFLTLSCRSDTKPRHSILLHKVSEKEVLEWTQEYYTTVKCYLLLILLLGHGYIFPLHTS